MTDLGTWFKSLPPLRVALGLVMMIFTAGISLGAAGASLNRIPSTVALHRIEIDTIKVKATRMDLALMDMTRTLARHIEQDSVATAWISCVVEAIYEGELVNPMNCRRN